MVTAVCEYSGGVPPLGGVAGGGAAWLRGGGGGGASGQQPYRSGNWYSIPGLSDRVLTLSKAGLPRSKLGFLF